MDRKRIEDALLEMGVPARLRGFTYICDAVELFSEDINMKMTKELYPRIGEKNGTTPQAVDRAIGVALEFARDYGDSYDEATVDYYIGISHCENSSSLKKLCMVLEHEQEKECASGKTNIQAIEEAVRKVIREELKPILNRGKKHDV